MTGKMELSYSGEERGAEMVSRRLIKEAVRIVFNEYFGQDDCQSTIALFQEKHRTFVLDDSLSAQEVVDRAQEIKGLVGRVQAYLKQEPIRKPEVLASGIEFMLEGLFALSARAN